MKKRVVIHNHFPQRARDGASHITPLGQVNGLHIFDYRDYKQNRFQVLKGRNGPVLGGFKSRDAAFNFARAYRTADRDATISFAKDAGGIFSRTTPQAFGKLSQQARREKSDAEAGRTWVVFALKKNGSRQASPFAKGERFTKEKAEEKIRYWESLNPGTKFEAVNKA